jgi:hypothetical protein
MCTKLETTVTTTSIIAVKESSFSDQLAEKLPEEIQLMRKIFWPILLCETSRKIITAQIAEITKSALEKIWANLSEKFLGKRREKIPENKKPKSGKKTVSLRSILIARKVENFYTQTD